MQQNTKSNRVKNVIEHFKNEASPKKTISKKNFLLMMIFGLLIGFAIPNTANSQINKPVETKQVKPEIDKLYERYKDSDIITLYTPHGELQGNVTVLLNDEGKPVSVTIKGNSENKSAIAEFISNTIKMKEEQGYGAEKTPFGWDVWSYTELVLQGLGWGFKEEHSFQLLMRKGNNMYFRADAGCCVGRSDYTWEIETGDSNRQGGKNATKFEF
jgi:hypothetical protein